MKVLELFGGICATSKALVNLNIPHETKYIDFDKSVVKVKNQLWGTNDEPIDITELETEENYDLVVAGFPCQPFSNAGKKLGFDDPRGKLYKDTLRIIKSTNPTYIILENVKGILQEKNIWIVREIVGELESLGYDVDVETINAKHFIAQNRERVFIIASKNKLNAKRIYNPYNEPNEVLKDYLEKDVEPSYYYNFKPIDKEYIVEKNGLKYFKLSDGSLRKIGFREEQKNWLIPLSSNYTSNIVNDPRGQLNTLTASSPKKIVEQVEPLKIRYITPREAYRLMGWEDEWIDKIIDLPKSNLYKTAGNSMVVPVMEHILKRLL